MSVSFKELYDVYLKATYPMEIGNRSFVPGEPVALLDKIQTSGLQEVSQYITAHGGYEDATRVIWDTTKEMRISFQQGVFSAEDLALAANANLVEYAQQSPIWVTVTEDHESDENGQFVLNHKLCNNLFVYNKTTGEKVNYTVTEETDSDGKVWTVVTVENIYTDFRVNYQYDDLEGCKMLQIGNRLTNTFLQLEGKTRVKDDTNGIVTTGLIVIPKFKLMSGLSIVLGAQATPISARFTGVGLPVGTRGNTRVCEFYFLNTDVDSDM